MELNLRTMTTETRNPNTMHLDAMTPLEIVTVMNQEDRKIPLAIEAVLPQIAKCAQWAMEAMQNGAAQEVDVSTIVPMPLPLKPAKLTNEMVTARFKRLPASDDVWDITVQAFPFPTQSDVENGAPTCPMMGMVVEENADEVVCLTIETASKPNCTDVLAQEILVEGIKRGNKPRFVRFASEKAAMALGGVFEALGIRTELQPELPQLQEAFLSLMQFSAGEEE